MDRARGRASRRPRGRSGVGEALVAPSPVLAVDALGYTAIIVELRGQFPLGSAKSATATKLGFAYRTL